MRCPDCNKFVGLEMQDPEVESLEIQSDDTGCCINVTARIVRCCADCGTELKEATVEEEITVPWTDMVDLDGKPLTGRPTTDEEPEVAETNTEQYEEGGGRYKKSWYGATVEFDINLEGHTLYSGSVTAKIPASHMDEMV